MPCVDRTPGIIQSWTWRSPLSAKDRVNKYRARLRAKQGHRFEVYLHLSLINCLREIAKRKHVSSRTLVEAALLGYAHSPLTPVTNQPTQ
jgi:hypothetical protein